MKTFIKKIEHEVLKVAVTILVISLIGLVYLYNTGNITVEEVSEDHNKVVMVDGVVTQESNWTTILGYKYKINLLDEMYVGR